MNIFVRSASWLALEKGMRVASGILVTASIARYLGPDSYGVLSVVMGTLAVFAAGAAMGADHINTAELSTRNLWSSMQFLSSALLARLLWSLACLVGLVIFVFYDDRSHAQLYLIGALIIPASALGIFANKIQADGEFSLYAKLSCAAMLLGAVVKLMGVFKEYDLAYFAAASVFDAVATVVLLGYWVYAGSTVPATELLPKWRAARAYINLCAPTAIAAILVALYLRLELFMVNSLLNGTSTGLWAGVVMFLAPWRMVASSVMVIANRHIAQSGINIESYDEKIVKLIRFMLLVSLVCVLLNTLLAKAVVPLLLGDKYFEISGVIGIVSLTLIPLFMGAVQDVWIAHQRTTSIVLKKVVIGLPLSFGILYFFIITYGLNGAAYGMVFSYFTTAVGLNLFYDRRFLVLQLRSIGVKHD